MLITIFKIVDPRFFSLGFFVYICTNQLNINHMSIYKEGFYALSEIQSQSIRIYDDACDYGVPVKKNDSNWNLAKQLFESYGDKSTRHQHDYSTGSNVYSFITLIDEWSVSDQRKTVKEATQTYGLYYTTCRHGKCKGYDGYISIRQL